MLGQMLGQKLGQMVALQSQVKIQSYLQRADG